MCEDKIVVGCMGSVLACICMYDVCVCVRVHRRIVFVSELHLPNHYCVSVYVFAVMFGELLCTSNCDPNESLQACNCVYVYVDVSAFGGQRVVLTHIMVLICLYMISSTLYECLSVYVSFLQILTYFCIKNT